MCKICKDRFNVHEKIAAHDYYEQLQEFNNNAIKVPRKRRITKKSLLSKIENELMKLQVESNEKHLAQLQTLMIQEIDLKTMNEQFKSIMMNYYESRLRELN